MTTRAESPALAEWREHWPIAAGVVFDHFGNYTALLLAGIPIGLISGGLVAVLGPYPVWQQPCRAVSNDRPR